MERKTQKNARKALKYARGDVLCNKCPSRQVLNHVTSRWGVLVLLALKDGEDHRYSELRRLITGISEKMLIQQLREMEADGLVDRLVHHEVPPRVEYSATELGTSLNTAMGPLADWGERYLKQRSR